MNDEKPVTFFLEPGLRTSAEAGQHNFIAKLARVVEAAGFSVTYETSGPRPRRASGHSLTHMKQPPNSLGLVFRRVYHYPFWQIDASAERWNWDVSKEKFAPETVDPKEADRFFRFWQARLFGDRPGSAVRDGFVYVPLQGRLSEQRSFQSCSPLQMLESCLEHEPRRRIIATLHPKETYSDVELQALEDLTSRFPRLSVRTGGMEELLQTCDYVATQNSSAAFNGYFFRKPTILFAEVDFHHIALNAAGTDLGAVFAAISDHAPDYAAYLWWFWQHQSINAGRPDAEEKIAARLKRFGWPMN